MEFVKDIHEETDKGFTTTLNNLWEKLHIIDLRSSSNLNWT